MPATSCKIWIFVTFISILHIVLYFCTCVFDFEVHFVIMQHQMEIYEAWPWSLWNDFIAIFTAYWEGSSSKYSPWAALHLAQWCCYCRKHFWNSHCEIAFSAIIIFLCHQYPEIFIPLSQTLFLERARGHSEPNQEYGGYSISVINFLDQKLLDRECLVSCSIFVVESPVVGSKFRTLATHNST